jgi:hypothetical protein
MCWLSGTAPNLRTTSSITNAIPFGCCEPALDFNIAKTKRDAMLIDIAPRENFAIAMVDSETIFTAS